MLHFLLKRFRNSFSSKLQIKIYLNSIGSMFRIRIFSSLSNVFLSALVLIIELLKIDFSFKMIALKFSVKASYFRKNWYQ